MGKFIFFVFSAIIISVVDCSPLIRVHTTTYDDGTFNFTSFPYHIIDDNPKLGHVVFLIVGANDFLQITKNETLQNEYHSLETKIKYNHGAHLALIGCFDIGQHDLYHVNDFIKVSEGRKIRTFGYGIFNTNYTIKVNLWDDHSIDLLLSEFMRSIYGDKYDRYIIPSEFITRYDPNPSSDRFDTFHMKTVNGKFESTCIVIFILIDGDKMDHFRQNKQHRQTLKQIVANEISEVELVFLLGCYHFQNNYYLIADTIEQQKGRLVEKYKGAMENDNIEVYVQGRGIWSSDFVFYNKSSNIIGKLIPNVDYKELDPFLDYYYKKTSKETEYRVYDCKLQLMQQLGFEYINGEYRSHAADDSFRFDPNYKIIKIIFIRKLQLDKIIADDSKLSNLKQVLIKSQPINHKIYIVECYGEISTYPNVIVSMLERHMGNYMKKQLGEVWLNIPKTIGPIQRNGDGGQFKQWSNHQLDDIVGNSNN